MCFKKYKYVTNLEKIKQKTLVNIVKLAVEQEITYSAVQRKLNIGFGAACDHINFLLDNNFLTKNQNQKYVANTDQLKKIKASKVVYEYDPYKTII